MQPKQTYWLYQGRTVLTGVRLFVGATDAQVKAHAKASYQACPRIGPSPAEIEGARVVAGEVQSD